MEYLVIKERISAAPEIRKSEVIRYLGGRGKEITPEAGLLIDEAIRLVKNACDCRICYIMLPLSAGESTADLGLMKIESRDLCRSLAGCSQALVFAATIGIETDNLIRRYGVLKPSLAAILQAAGAAAVEALCDSFCGRINEMHPLRPRFSPGYGDLPLSSQREVFRILDCPKNAGITLTDSLLMIPSKSVTAIAGVKHVQGSAPAYTSGCGDCNIGGTCSYRR